MTKRARLSIVVDSTALRAVDRELLVATTKRHAVSVMPFTVLRLLADLATITDKRAAFANLLKCQHVAVLPNTLSDAMTLLSTTSAANHRYFLEPAFSEKIIRMAASSGSYDDFMSRSFVIHDEPVPIADVPVTVKAVLAPMSATVNTQVQSSAATLKKELGADGIAAMTSENTMRFVVAAVVVVADQRKAQLTTQQMSAVYGFVAACVMRARLQLAAGNEIFVRDDVEFALLPLHLVIGETVVVSDDSNTREVLTMTDAVVSSLVRRGPRLRTAAVIELRGNGPVSGAAGAT